MAIKAGKVRDSAVLIRLAKTDEDASVRSAAIRQIEDDRSTIYIVTTLINIAKTDKNEGVRQMATKRIAELAGKLKEEDDIHPILNDSKKIKYESALINIAKTDAVWSVRIAAVAWITNDKALIDIAKTDVNGEVRLKAAERIRNQAVLINIAKTDRYLAVRLAAVDRVADESALAAIATADEDKEVREAVCRKIGHDLGGGKYDRSGYYSCKRCGARLPACDLLGHDFVLVPRAGSVKPGNNLFAYIETETHRCTRCGYTENRFMDTPSC
jgi:hypothetical protein